MFFTPPYCVIIIHSAFGSTFKATFKALKCKVMNLPGCTWSNYLNFQFEISAVLNKDKRKEEKKWMKTDNSWNIQQI